MILTYSGSEYFAGKERGREAVRAYDLLESKLESLMAERVTQSNSDNAFLLCEIDALRGLAKSAGAKEVYVLNAALTEGGLVDLSVDYSVVVLFSDGKYRAYMYPPEGHGEVPAIDFSRYRRCAMIQGESESRVVR
jgi:hypothetical protein